MKTNQTTPVMEFSVSSIISLFSDKRTGIHKCSKCFWVNKLGDLCLNGKDPEGRGAKFLLQEFVLNKSEAEEYRVTALCFLLILKGENEEIRKGLEDFEKEEDCKELFARAEKMVHDFFLREETL